MLEIYANGKGRINRSKSESRLTWVYLHHNLDLDLHYYGMPTQKDKDSVFKSICELIKPKGNSAIQCTCTMIEKCETLTINSIVIERKLV